MKNTILAVFSIFLSSKIASKEISVTCLTEETFLKKFVSPKATVPFNYSTLKAVAKGGFGVVYQLAQTDRPRVLKKVNITAEMTKEEILWEIVIQDKASQLGSGPKLYACVLTPKWIGVVIERLYWTLKSATPQVIALPFWRRVSLYAAIMQKIIFLSSKGIVHNDIKPDNIMLNKELTDARLVDFGTSCNVGNLSGGGSIPFTPPEKINANMKACSQSATDIWGFLTTLAWVESGYNPKPIEELVPAKCLEHVDKACYERMNHALGLMLAGTEKPLRDYILKSLTFEASDRPSASQVYMALTKIWTDAII